MRSIKSPAQHLCKDIKVEVPKAFGSRPSDGSKKAVASHEQAKSHVEMVKEHLGMKSEKY